jgi:SAM-dependent methyltransferase
MKNISFHFKSISKIYNKMSVWGKLLLIIVIFLSVIVFFKKTQKNKIEGFTDTDSFIFKTGEGVYDDFYVNIYDLLFYSDLRDNYEVGDIINTTYPDKNSRILDIGCGTGHHVNEFASKNYNIIGIDNSIKMISKAKELYPQHNFFVKNALNGNEFKPQTFTHIISLYYTVYHIKDKNLFFSNCYNWLTYGGYLVIHLVDREMFDPILNAANPLIMLSPQRYAKDRITTSSITFDDFKYNSNFELDKDNDKAIFTEKFVFNDTNKTRKNEHVLYMPSEEQILQIAKDEGFIVQSKIDLIKTGYEYNYLYVFKKNG